MDFIACVNGNIVETPEGQVSLLDRGFLFGDCVFEVMVAFNGKILNKESHLSRLRASAASLHMEIPWSNDVLGFELEGVLGAMSCPKSYLRLTITRGEGLGLSPQNAPTPQRYLIAMPAKEEKIELYSKGIKLQMQHQNHTTRGPAAKTGNYLDSIMAIEKAQRAGYGDVLWINGSGEITECSTSNVFLIGRDGDLVEIATPPAESGILLGITRATVMRLLNNAQIPVTERVIVEDEMPRFDEAFVCSTVRGIIPVTAIGNHKLYTTRKNSVYKHISRLHNTWVRSELGHGVDWNTGKIS